MPAIVPLERLPPTGLTTVDCASPEMREVVVNVEVVNLATLGFGELGCPLGVGEPDPPELVLGLCCTVTGVVTPVKGFWPTVCTAKSASIVPPPMVER